MGMDMEYELKAHRTPSLWSPSTDHMPQGRVGRKSLPLMNGVGFVWKPHPGKRIKGNEADPA